MTIILEAAMRPERPPLSGLKDSATVAAIVCAEEWEVRERFFIADVTFLIDGIDLSRSAEALIDFGMSLRSSLDELAMSGTSELQFQGTPSRIKFALTGADVHVSANFAEGEAICPYIELYRAVLVFVRDALDAVTRAAPEILKNDFIEYLYRTYAVREKGNDQFMRHGRVVADSDSRPEGA
ncbi:hypothetical protein [Actinoplanes sp. NPDC051494]|uniref:hypothetical protein n=1 Tax=Actinoplanes sp. NPDC051494 TaxID=3363907 RepID=UPI0037B8B9F5